MNPALFILFVLKFTKLKFHRSLLQTSRSLIFFQTFYRNINNFRAVSH